MIPNNKWIAVLIMGLVTIALGCLSMVVVHTLGKKSWDAPVWTGYLIAAALAVPSYLSLAWSLRQSDKVFYGVFIGGIFFRLTGFAATALVIYRLGRWPIGAVMLPLVFGLIFSSFVEIYFIQKEARV